MRVNKSDPFYKWVNRDRNRKTGLVKEPVPIVSIPENR